MSSEAESRPRELPWLFSGPVDLLAFGGSAALAGCLLLIGGLFGWLHQDTPSWAWVVAILLIDVAHVYATGFRVYFDRKELSRRPWLYGLTPALAWAISWALYSESIDLFWRCLAYLAVFHFVRQQFGWVALYRSKAGETDRWGRRIDTAAIYLATLYPLAYWHCHLPREFWWFRPDDFARFSFDWSRWLAPIYWVTLSAYVAKSLVLAVRKHHLNPGKDLVVATTAVCWYVGIITFNSDYAFTVTNVIIHGIPYMVLVYWYHRSVQAGDRSGSSVSTRRRSLQAIVRFIGLIWILAYIEELVWDRGLWHERSWLFGSPWDLQSVEAVLVPLLAVPQITHYVLDGFIWRRRSSRRVAQLATAN
ncbi:hypothetical protein FYK55_23240 [Roseiconus nitratireducens]|uniref:Uncharacterized protein n=1 Tax=Roseiconus nitratireducens TaxID=2605748 RepID=A0A5M6CWW7_9BACT|nr:hypothetical protein [Roseiconus nitratireducens]KAA5539718.1 hypothetical protein FYK55_23240 [Roseiconus nitratireducens]